MKKSTKNAVLTFVLFLITVAAYGAVIALVNNLLRTYGYESKYTTSILVASTIYVYYKCWKWLCRKLNLIEAQCNDCNNTQS